MGILDGVVEWISEQIMHGLDLINTSVLGALGCGMETFLRYFPAAETMYDIFTAVGIGLILLMWVWNLFKNYWLGAGFEAEHPVKLTFRAIIFITLTYCAKSIVEIVLKIGGTPYDWILQVFIKRPFKDGFFHQKGLIHRQDAFSGVVVSGFGTNQQFQEIHYFSSSSFLIRWIVR